MLRDWQAHRHTLLVVLHLLLVHTSVVDAADGGCGRGRQEVLLLRLLRCIAIVLLVLLIWSRTIVLLVGRCGLLSVLSLGILLRQRVVLLLQIVLLGRHDVLLVWIVLLVCRVLTLCLCC